jgi:uncharacterized protein (UPF0332 family)
MSVTPNDFLHSAQTLAALGNDEINQRNAISRVYYAAFHRSCEIFKPDGVDRKKGSHYSYILQLEEAVAGSLERRVGVNLNVIYGGRVRSDYKLDQTVSASDFSLLLSRTKAVFTLLHSSPPQPPQTPQPPQQQPPTRHTPQFKIIK